MSTCRTCGGAGVVSAEGMEGWCPDCPDRSEAVVTAFIVVPKPINNGRATVYEVIDTAAYDPTAVNPTRTRSRIGHYDDEHQARAVADVLNGAEKVYRATLDALAKAEAF